MELGYYKHYKGNVYEVIGIAKHSETLEDVVVYKACYQKEGENLWVRPLKIFEDDVFIENKKTKRFSKI